VTDRRVYHEWINKMARMNNPHGFGYRVIAHPVPLANWEEQRLVEQWAIEVLNGSIVSISARSQKNIHAIGETLVGSGYFRLKGDLPTEERHNYAHSESRMLKDGFHNHWMATSLITEEKSMHLQLNCLGKFLSWTVLGEIAAFTRQTTFRLVNPTPDPEATGIVPPALLVSGRSYRR
jgi:hypothetical protein